MTIYNLISIFGIVALIAIAFLFSDNRRKIQWKIVGVGLLMEFIFAFLILRTGPGRKAFEWVSDKLMKVLSFSDRGTDFVFGPLFRMGDKTYFVFFFNALVPIVFFGSIIGLLYHLGIMQRIVRWMAYMFTRFMGLSSAEALGVASNVFLGQTQAPMVVAPYVKSMTRSELFLTMVGGMATVAGSMLIAYVAMGADVKYVLAASIMAAPGAIIMAKIMIPETDVPETSGANAKVDDKANTVNMLDALASGAMEGWQICLGVAIMLLSFVSIIYLLDYIIGYASMHVASWFGSDYKLTLDILLGWIFRPVAWMIGVPREDTHQFAVLIGQKTAFNEFIAYGNLGKTALSPRAFMMVCFALTGFANFSSIAIQIGGIGAIAPTRRHDIARLGIKAVIAGALANLLSAAIAGLLFMETPKAPAETGPTTEAAASAHESTPAAHE